MPRPKTFDRDEVLHKAMDLFWQKGYHATSMQDLVDHLGISRASMYATFPDGKEQLYREAFQLYQQTSGAELRSVDNMLKQQSVREFLTNFFNKELVAIQSDEQAKGCFVVNTITELSNQSEAIFKLVQQNLQTFTAIFTRILKIGQEREEIRRDQSAQALARHLFTFYNGFKVVSKVERDAGILKEMIEVELAYLFGR